jgi:hypothetical protein
MFIAGESHDPICCTTATVDFYSERYDAVSYTWATEDGDDRKTGRIHFSDGVVVVPENCEAALRQLRSRSEPRQVWVDARCINQTNLEERSHQVSIMGQIYRMAATVWVCTQDSRHLYTECMRLLSAAYQDPSIDTIEWPPSAMMQTKELFQRRYFTKFGY